MGGGEVGTMVDDRVRGAGDMWSGGGGQVEGGQAADDTTVGEYLNMLG